MKLRKTTLRQATNVEGWTFLYHELTGGNDPIEPNADGCGDGYGYGYGHQMGLLDGFGFGYGSGQADGHAWGQSSGRGSSGGTICFQVLPMTHEEGRRTERVFRCAGCIGGFECSIHGSRL